jgi:hypothetical protein
MVEIDLWVYLVTIPLILAASVFGLVLNMKEKKAKAAAAAKKANR